MMTHVSNLINEIPKESTEGFRNECRVIGFNRYVRKGRVKIYKNNKTEIQCNGVVMLYSGIHLVLSCQITTKPRLNLQVLLRTVLMQKWGASFLNDSWHKKNVICMEFAFCSNVYRLWINN